jgi:hypothetical protein
MLLKKLYALVLLVVSLTAVHGQKHNMEQVIYLQDSSVIRGAIKDTVNGMIRIKVRDGSVFAYPSSAIIKTTYEKRSPVYEYANGFGNFTEIGALIAGKTTIEGVTTAAFSFQTVNGYSFSNALFAGLGLGADLYATQTFIPVFASLRGNLLKSGTLIPFYFLDGGYGVNITQDSPGNEDFKGGILYAAGLGLKIPFNKTAGFLISLGYRYQASEYTQNGFGREIVYRRLALRAGFFL